MSIQHRLYFKSCFICQTNEEGKWGLEPYDLASLVVINPIHRERNMLYLLLHPFRRMRATSPEGGSFAEHKEKILNLICFCPFVPHPLPYSLPRLGRRVYSTPPEEKLDFANYCSPFPASKNGAEAPLMILFPLSFYIRPLTNTKRMRSGST